MFPYNRLALALLATGVLANPLPTDDPCSTVRCTKDTECTVIDGAAQCVPIILEDCGPTTCGRGEVCCNFGCGICTQPGGMCPMHICPPTGPKCGPNQCYDGEECCNESCGTCVAPGGFCTMQWCGSLPGEQCGPNTCAEGEVCCNESCGTCTKPGEGCTDELCGVESRDEPKGEECGPNICAADETCCNSSCGYCTKPGEGCTREFCDLEDGVVEPESE